MRLKMLTVNLTNAFVGLVEVALGLRFVLKLFGADASNGFVSWVYSMSSVLLAPFRGIFPVQVFENKYVLEFSTLFAMLVYALIGLAIYMLIDVLTASAKASKK